MASLKDIRIRIASVKSTRKITSAMKVVSAAKFHKAQDQQARFQKYQDKFSYTLGLAIAHCENYNHPLLEDKVDPNTVVVLVFTSNSSLCGAYNMNAINEAKRKLDALQKEGKKVIVYTFGKQAYEGLKNHGVTIAHHDEDMVAKPTFEAVSKLYEGLQKEFLQGNIAAVHVIYNHFRNAAVQESCSKLLLPVKAEFDYDPQESKGIRTEYIIEPSPKEFFDFALPHFGKLSLYTYVLNNYVGEHGARMTAMSQATDNANTLVNDLTLEYNKARQAAITNEILEIVSGANALQNG